MQIVYRWEEHYSRQHLHRGLDKRMLVEDSEEGTTVFAVVADAVVAGIDIEYVAAGSKVGLAGILGSSS